MQDPDLPTWSISVRGGAVTGANFRIGDMYADGNGVQDTTEAGRGTDGVEMANRRHRGWMVDGGRLSGECYLQIKGVPRDYK